jgi:hypothetical protein
VTPADSGDLSAVRDFLARQDRGWLADELIRVAETDPLVAARLRAAAESEIDSSGGGSDVLDAGVPADMAQLRHQMDDAIRPYAYPEYGAARGYADRMHGLLDQVEYMSRDGFPDAAIGMAEHALRLLEEAYGFIDDSDGELGSVQVRAEAIHLAACEAGRPDPVMLGTHLAAWALRSDWEIFAGAPSEYAEVLGPAGLAAFESVVDEEFLKLPRLAPEEGRDLAFRSERYRPTHLKESLAALRGPDAVVEVIAHDLSAPYRFLRAAEVLAEAGRDDDALDWLARGSAAFEGSDRPDARLGEFAADLHHRNGRHGQAAEIAWEQFRARPELAGYQRLHDFASAAGEWAERRTAAVQLLRARPVAGEPDPRSMLWVPLGHSTLVEVLMWEDDIEAAWEAAHHGGCTRYLWLALARRRAAEKPADAIPVLQREILAAVGRVERAGYREGAELAKELRGYAERAGKSEEFTTWILGVRRDNVRRPALQDEFSRAGLPRAARAGG